MEESFRGEEITPEYDHTEEGEIRVFFEDEEEGSIILEIAESEMDSFALIEGRHHYEKLYLSDGLLLKPTPFVDSHARALFAESLEVVLRPQGRTVCRVPNIKTKLHSLM